MSDINVLEMRDIVKKFGENTVLDGVNFELAKGEVHALVGANGAGKSTLVKILNGILVNYEGEIILNGKKTVIDSPSKAYEVGIAMIHQELDLVENLEVCENIFLGREICRCGALGVNRKIMREESQKLLDSLDFPIKADELVGNLSTAMQQLVLIARTVDLKADVVIMDEPTSSLSISETENLFKVIANLKKQGVSIIYISHFLEEIFKVAERVTVLRDGKKIITTEIDSTNHKQLVELMVGHKIDSERQFLREKPSDEVVLKVKDMTQKNGLVKDVSFELRKGEVLGIAGVVGSGRTELARMIFGAEEKAKGDIIINGRNAKINSPMKAVEQNMAFVPEDRKIEGLILKRTISDNISVVALKETRKLGIIQHDKVRKIVRNMIEAMKIKCISPNQQVSSLSGGNQQKVVIGKWLSVNSKILILDQPTRGIDVGAKEEIYNLVDSLAKKGTSVIFISDELEEIYSLSDRVLVMKRGKIVAEYENYDRSLNKITLLSSMIGDAQHKEVQI